MKRMKCLILVFAFELHRQLVNGELPEPVSCENDHSGTSLQTCIQNTLKSLQLDYNDVLRRCNSQLVIHTVFEYCFFFCQINFLVYFSPTDARSFSPLKQRHKQANSVCSLVYAAKSNRAYGLHYRNRCAVWKLTLLNYGWNTTTSFHKISFYFQICSHQNPEFIHRVSMPSQRLPYLTELFGADTGQCIAYSNESTPETSEIFQTRMLLWFSGEFWTSDQLLEYSVRFVHQLDTRDRLSSE
jgi:hypothetical protein